MLPVLTAIFALILFLVVLCNDTLRRKKLPPGPQGLPIIGNLFQFPQVEAWKYHETETLRKYGDVAYMEAFGQPIIILSSYDAAYDLFVKRSSIYSDRPRFPVCRELMGANLTTPFASYGALWRTHRRLWHQHFGRKAMEQYHALIQRESRAFAARLLENDANVPVRNQLKLWVVKSLVDAVFGIKVNSLDDELVAFTDKVALEVGESLTPGRYMADIFPILLHVPEWFPGAGWKRHCAVIRGRVIKICNVPYEYTKAAVLSGDASPAFVSSMMEDSSADELTKAWVSASAYGGGVDSILNVMTRFIVNMMIHPEIQRWAQEEIDRLTGGHRLPALVDTESARAVLPIVNRLNCECSRTSLPYIDAVIQELLRWNTPAPFGVPHRLTQDDEYRGYTIPKGSTVILNLWTISRDPKHYPDPDDFRPERFLESDADNQPMDPRLYCFGVGRRICPGRHFVDVSLYLAITTILATSTILKPVDENGKEYMPEVRFVGPRFDEVEPFIARIRPRSTQAAELLRELSSGETDN